MSVNPDIKDGISKDDEERIVKFCNKSHPYNVALDDWFTQISILSKAGIVDLQNEQEDDLVDDLTDTSRFSCDIDRNGRIKGLNIVATSNRLFDLPVEIRHLQMLDYLYVDRYRSLCAKELSTLPSLNNLTLARSDDLLDNFPIEMELKHLRERLPQLGNYQLSCIGNSSMTRVLGALLTHITMCGCFEENLCRLIIIQCCLLDNDHLFSNITDLQLPLFKQTQSLRSIADTMRSETNQGAARRKHEWSDAAAINTAGTVGKSYSNLKSGSFTPNLSITGGLYYLVRKRPVLVPGHGEAKSSRKA
eukprot:jgi/Psemu1/68134/estExt_Genemark1.C_4410034